MKLKELIDGIYQGPLTKDDSDIEVSGISSDSRSIHGNEVFVAIRGAQFDGRQFIPAAIQQGARVVVTDASMTPEVSERACVLNVDDANLFLRKIVPRFYGDPSQAVNVWGVTGTNGKTTITYLMESIWQASGKSCGVVGTINHRIGNQIYPAMNTTPGFLENQRFLHELQHQEISQCVMEVSSHALAQNRVDNINFQGGIFTNLTQDHLDYHGSMEKYFQAKARLFELVVPDGLRCVNADDPYGQRLIQMYPHNSLPYGMNQNAKIRATEIRYSVDGTEFRLWTPSGNRIIRTRLLGSYNVSNVLAAAALAYGQGESLDVIQRGVESLTCVPGRLEVCEAEQGYSILIDYAHTPDALENVLKTLRALCSKRIILVFGCGGDRDQGKRPLMGQVASRLADYAIVTSDNPRNEDPIQIINHITNGFIGTHYEVIMDRELAIGKALNIAMDGDMVLIAGKGHEDYQIKQGQRIEFEERSIVRKYLRC